jgi:hypothetical protein
MKSVVFMFAVIDLTTEFPSSILLHNTINEHTNSVYHLFLSESSMFLWADHHQGDLPPTQTMLYVLSIFTQKFTFLAPVVH